MWFDIFITLTVNLLILLSISTIHTLLPQNKNLSTTSKNILLGLYVGITGTLIMTIPFDFNNGVFFDTRSILLTSSGIFFGPVVTIIGTIPMIVYRIFIGGSGLYSGILEIIISGFLGICFRQYQSKRKKNTHYKLKDLFIFAYLTQTIIFSLFFLVDKNIRYDLMLKMWYIFLFFYPLASVLIYLFHINQHNRLDRVLSIQESEAQYKSLFEGSHVTLMVIDLEGNIIDVNQTGLDFYGWTLDEIKTMNIKEINTLSSKEIQEKINLCINKQQNFFSFKHRIASGKTIDVEVYSGPIKIKNNNYILSTVIDVTDKMKYQEILIKEKNNYQYISYHDHLTGLYNRLYFEDAVHRLSTERQLPLSVIYADLNNLKEVNDQFSHLVGDHLIKEVANILKKSVRSEDIVSRWGGDEFVILLPNTPNDRVKLAVKRIENLCKKSNFEQFSPSLAIGYDTKIEITDNPFDILENAEQKMYLNKNE